MPAAPPPSPATFSQRYHRGPLGAVLDRHLGHPKGVRQGDYPLHELEALWLEAAKTDPAIGLNLFSYFTPQDWHILLHICFYCQSVLGALQLWARFTPLATDNEVVSVITDQQGTAMHLQADFPCELARFNMEHYGVMAVSQLSRGTGLTIRPKLACFSHPRPAYFREYVGWFGDNLQFDAPHTRLYFSDEVLATPMQMRHTGVLELLTSELERRLAQRLQLNGMAARVGGQLRQLLAQGDVPSLESMASAIHLSPRTLRRRLEEQGLTFRQLLDQVRYELEQHLELQGKSRTEIAARLGYTDLSAYQQARKRWRDRP
ncbi:AraC family transcriptional regulator ligand-binding domain-containing protein [Pseudomonas aeruginosa]|uniref:AraC family transcriptional regulator ligand-binding domain-containing protein n=1 Tax=Pseudomonas aeruginosa TaxID=287 RepID=UPI003F2FB737